MKIIDVRFQTSCVVGDTLAMIRGTSPFSTADIPRSVLRSLQASPQRRHSRSPSFREKVTKKVTDTSQDSPLLSPLRCLSPEPELDISGNESYDVIGSRPMPYFSGRPPIQPLHIVPLSVTASPIYPLNQQIMNKPQANFGNLLDEPCVINLEKGKKKETVSIVHNILSVLVASLPVFDTHNIDTKKSSQRTNKHRDKAVQVQGLSCIIRDDVCDAGTEDFSICSDGEENTNTVCAWLNSLRALRDSHVRLLLRQLRQLKQIEKLEYAMKHT